MTIETATYIHQLNESLPAGSDAASEGDDHIRLVKATLKNTFPNIAGAVSVTPAQLNVLSGLTASAAELNIMDGATITTSELNRLSGVTSNIQAQLNTKMPLPTIEVKTSSFTAQNNYHYVMRTSAGTMTLPASPSTGMQVWATNDSGAQWTIGNNGQPIMGVMANDTIANRAFKRFVYIDSTIGWVRFA